MNRQPFSSRISSPRSLLLGLLTFLLLLTLSACSGNNNSVRVYDNARVLNSSKVQNAASNLSNPLAIYTTNTFQGTAADFQRTAIQKLNGNPNLIVMAIDTNSRYIYIARGANVPLSSSGINQAVNAFAGSFNNGDYTNASVAALNSLQNSLNATSAGRGSPTFSPLIPCLLIPLLLILGVALFAIRRGRMRGITGQGSQWQPARGPQPNEGQYYGPNNQGYDPYNQGYGPSNQRGGMNPWAAGGLGAAAGGLAGYELGKMSGEREGERNDFGGDDFGAGGGGNFGGNDPNGNFGGGGNFGNSGDAGGGGNFGGSDAGGGGFFGGNNDPGGGGSFGGTDDFGGSSSDNSGGGSNF